MQKTRSAMLLSIIFCLVFPAYAFDLKKDIKKFAGKVIKEIPFIDHSPCKEYIYDGGVRRVCLRGDVDLTGEQIEYTKGFAPNIIQCIHEKEVWVEVLFVSDQYSIRLFDSEKSGKAFGGGTDKKYEKALQHLRKNVCS